MKFSDELDPDVFVKRILSFIELAFRESEHPITYINSQLLAELRKSAMQALAPQRTSGMRILGAIQSNVERVQRGNDFVNANFKAHVDELNERLIQAGLPLHYHTSYIQITTDSLTQAQIEEPFWDVVKDS